ncbi:4'-phosphopantetheinyl transferase family protein [Streptomyces brasiliensis]|uniref:4-phosphopantetheinyl transferase n=1 Tax=Streptomyces brasiliensis TaxID=1954 RepID=A0A917P6E0_9ACTN|nr:hypothetical protein [Streptomyces brasiliensis]GGJ63601.1 hypothetical protein GCM10010121_087720 [Streptomyces brasiliensis]
MSTSPALWLIHADPSVAPSSLDAAELHRAHTLAGTGRTEIHDRYVAAHTGLRRLLAARLGVPPRQVALTREPCPVCGGPHGRPAVAGGTPHFSLAYSGSLCLVALADTPVGVDMERIPPSELVNLHPREQDELMAMPEDKRPLAFP